MVDPPQWGDPVFRLQRGSSHPETGRELKAGTAYVRRPGTTVAANDSDLERLKERAAVPRPRLDVMVDWNLGQRGDYAAVNVRNGPAGHKATLWEVGFTMEGIFTREALPDVEYAEGEPRHAGAYASLPITHEQTTIDPGDLQEFRVPLGRAPFFWDEDTKLYPYTYFDEHRWLVGEPSPLGRLLHDKAWVSDDTAEHMFKEMFLDFVWPPSVSGLRGTFDLTATMED